MAIFYFHLIDGVDRLLDPDGRDLESGTVAGAALAEARAIIAADARSGHIYLNQSIEVQDSDGIVVHRVAFEDAVKVTHEALSRSR